MRTPIEVKIGGFVGFRGTTAIPPSAPVRHQGSGGSDTGSHIVSPTGPASRGFPPAPYRQLGPLRLQDAADAGWVQQIVERVNNILQGRLNVTLPLSLTASSSTTIVTDARIGAFSSLLFCPLTANAALEIAAGTLFVSEQKSGSATITHANNAQADRTFSLVILG